MKKHYFLPLAAAMLLFAGCSDRNDEPGAGESGDGSTDTQSFLAVNIVPTFPSSRAVEDDKNYEAGEAAENEIKSVRFYFFTSDGAAARVKRTKEGDMVNYLDLEVIPESNNKNPEGMPNVEKGLKAVLVINTAKGDERPAKILAIINRSSRFGLSTADLATVRGTNNDYADFAQTEGQFVMSSAVYAATDKSGSTYEVSATTIPEECFLDEESTANPVVIYVERVVAKVRMKLDAKELNTTELTENGKTRVLVPLKDKEGNNIMINNTQVYAKFLGWNVTAATEQSSVNKHINPSWTIFPDWNYAPYFRSFWALNCENAGSRYMPFVKKNVDGTVKTYSVIDGNEVKTSYTSLYTNENAAAHVNATNGEGRAYPSTVIMAAQLCDSEGKAVLAHHWLGQTHVGNDELLTSMLAQLAKTGDKIYSKSGNTISDIKAEDLKLVTAATAGKATLDETTTGRYKTYVVLSETGAAKQWYNSPECTTSTEMTTAAVNTHLTSHLGAAEVWENGYTYYYFPIQHLGTMGEDGVNRGAYGVVRNHVYEANVNSIIGLGTPVYDPKETIYPEKPDNSNTYVAARINVQTWRLVHNDVTLDWSNK